MYSIRIRPLRDRRDEIPALVDHILRTRHSTRGARPTPSPSFLRALLDHPLKGNVRELEGLVLGAVVRARGDRTLRPEHLPREPVAGVPGDPRDERSAGLTPLPPYAEMERDYIRSVLRQTGGNKKQAAAVMGIPRTTLNARIRKLGLQAEG
jgi:DNA-binding NtrC family response regulator